jgi:hypothetical protein
VAESALGGRAEVPLEEMLTGDWRSTRRVLADLASIDLRPELPYRLRWSDALTADPEGHPSWLSHGALERTGDG